MQAAELIQSAMRGHMSRKQNMGRQRSWEDETTTDSVTESELESAAELIQSNVRAHWSRKDQLRKR